MATTISTTGLTYTSANKTLTGQASTFGLTTNNYPDTLGVRSEKTGTVRDFRLVSEEMEDFILYSARYTSLEMSLVIVFADRPTVQTDAEDMGMPIPAPVVPTTPAPIPVPAPTPVPAPVVPVTVPVAPLPAQERVNYVRLSNGTWALEGSYSDLTEGRQVRVTTRNGAVRIETVGRALRSRNGMARAEIARNSIVHPETNGHTTTTAPVAPTTPPVAPVVSNVNFSQEDVSKLGEMVLVDYDVVNGASYENEEGQTIRVYNPAWFFHGFAGRTTKSVWVCRKAKTPWHWIAEARKASAIVDGARKYCDVNVISIGVPGPEILQLVLSNLQRDIANAEASLKKSLTNYATTYERESNDPTGSPTAALETYQKNCKAATKTCEKRINTLRKFAAEFNLTNHVGTEASRIRDVASNLQKLTDIRATSYVDLAARMKGTQLETAAANDEIPACVMADMLEEQGEDVGSVREVF